MACAGAADRAMICAEVFRCHLRTGSGSRWPQTLLDTQAAFRMALMCCPPMPISILPAIALQVAAPFAVSGLYAKPFASLQAHCTVNKRWCLPTHKPLEGTDSSVNKGQWRPENTCKALSCTMLRWLTRRRGKQHRMYSTLSCVQKGFPPFCRKLGVEAIHNTPRS